MTLRAGGGLSTISKLNEALDDEFKAELNGEVNGASFFKLLSLPKSDILYVVLEVIVSHYNNEEKLFKFGDICLHVTLEDVLYLTGLPIRGKPVICETSRSRDKTAFSRIFDVGELSQMSHVELINIAKDRQGSPRIRKIAVLLTLFSSVVIPSYDERDVKTTFVHFFENLDEVNSYAWGAALLAFLYCGLDGYNGRRNKSLKGNAWVLLSFFLIRIPKLAKIIEIDLALENAYPPLLGSIVGEVTHISYNHKPKYKENVILLFENLSEDDIEWTPYQGLQLPPHLQDEVKFGTLIAPIFCNNYVAKHRPYRVSNQFRVLKGLSFSHRLDKLKIKSKKNSGDSEQNFKNFFKTELEIWDEQTLAVSLITPSNTNPTPSNSSHSPVTI